MNPYLAQSAIIAAGLSGIERAMTLPPEHRGDAYGSEKAPEVPGNLRDAADAMNTSAMPPTAMRSRRRYFPNGMTRLPPWR